jgi:hypothetical protein
MDRESNICFCNSTKKKEEINTAMIEDKTIKRQIVEASAV